MHSHTFHFDRLKIGNRQLPWRTGGRMKKLAAASLVSLLVTGTFPTQILAAGHGDGGSTATPIKHLVVIFQENVSFDHYFGTYPYATNPPHEPRFRAKPGTPGVNGYTEGLLF